MINRLKHYVDGAEVVPSNKEDFTLNVEFGSKQGEWMNNFTTGNKLVLSHEGYENVINHINTKGIQQQIPYNLQVNGNNNQFYLDTINGLSIDGHFLEVDIKNFISKDNIKTSIDSLTFEYLRQKSVITDSDFVNIPYIIIPQDVGAKILNISIMTFVLTKDLVDKGIRVSKRVGDLLAGTLPQPAPPTVAIPIGLTVRYSILVAVDIIQMLMTIVMLVKLIKDSFNLLLPPLRNFKAMTADRLLSIGLGHFGIGYSSTIINELKKITILPVPIDEQKKKFFSMLLGQDTRVLNRGYPTASDTVPTLGSLIDELCKIFNISPRIENNTLILNPRMNAGAPLNMCNLDNNFNDEKKTNRYSIDTSGIWNTKIISYVIDPTDKMLFDSPKGSNIELKTTVQGVTDELTIVKGFEEIRINFALGTIKKDTIFEDFLKGLAILSDKILNTSFQSKLNKRLGVLALSQEQFATTKLLYQVGGKQPENYLDNIGATALYKKYHAIDDSINGCGRVYSDVPIRMNNSQFLQVLNNNFVTLEGQVVELKNVSYTPESSQALITYKVPDYLITKKLKTRIVYAE